MKDQMTQTGMNMFLNDLREFIDEMDRLGDCKVVENVDWNLEIGLITEWQSHVPDNKLLLFDKIRDFPPTVMSSPDELKTIREKWGKFFEQ